MSAIDFHDAATPQFVGPAWDQDIEPPRPNLVPLVGGGSLLYSGMTHTIAAPSGTGKSWIALAAMLAAAADTGRPVLLLDYEASIEVAISRLRQLGAGRADADRVGYWQLDRALTGDTQQALTAWVDRHQPCLVVLDGVTRATALHGIDAETDNAGYTDWAALVEKTCRANGGADDPALLLIDHVSEKTGSGLNARGVTAKRDTVTGAAYMLTGGPVSPHREARFSLVIAKGRHGGERGTPAAHVVTRPAADGQLEVRFVAPDQGPPATDARDAALRRDICRRLQQHGPHSKRALLAAIGGDHKATARALAGLIADGQVAADTDAPKVGGHHPYRHVPLDTVDDAA